MTIVVIGAGAIGQLVAGRLAQAGQRTVLLARPAAAAALARQPLQISESGRLHVAESLVTISDPSMLAAADRPPDLAIVCVKGYDTASVLPALDALAPSAVLTLQNGIGNEELLAMHVGAGRVVSGAITTSVEVAAPGRIAVAKAGGVGVAAMAPGARAAAGRAAQAFRAAGFVVSEVADYRALKWSKALLNMLGNATAAILDMAVADAGVNPQLIALERQAFREALGRSGRPAIRPINLPRYPAALLARYALHAAATAIPDLAASVAGGRGRKPPAAASTRRAAVHVRRANFLYGAVARAAAEAGLAAPVNRALSAILQAISSGAEPWDVYRRHPERLLAEVAATRGVAE
ncbi:MAG: 2-dehydropantoate 2-reductase [Kouleothrix sp.]